MLSTAFLSAEDPMNVGRIRLFAREVTDADTSLLMNGVTAQYADEFEEYCLPIDCFSGVVMKDRHTGLAIAEFFDGRKWLVNVPFDEFVQSPEYQDTPLFEIKDGELIIAG